MLLTPTLTDPGGEPADRRLRRNSGTPATVTPLPPRVRAASDPPEETPTPAVPATDGSAAVSDDGAVRPSRPSLRVVGEALRRGARPAADRSPPSSSAADVSEPSERSRLFDVDRILPADPERRAALLARLRRVGVGAGVATVVAIVCYTVFPVRTWLDLRAAEQRAEERQEVFEAEIEILEDEVEDLRTRERVESEARPLGLVFPGEESYGIYPAPEADDDTGSTTTTAPPGG